MPPPIRRSPRRNSLLDALELRPNLQEVARSPSCESIATVPIPDPDAHSSDDEEPLSSLTRQRLLRNRPASYREAVVPITCARPTAAPEPEPSATEEIVSESPGGSRETPSSSSVIAPGYEADDWDRPTGQPCMFDDVLLYPEDWLLPAIELEQRDLHYPLSDDEGFSSDEYNPYCNCGECLDHFYSIQQEMAMLWGPVRLVERSLLTSSRQEHVEGNTKGFQSHSEFSPAGPYHSPGLSPAVMCCYYKQKGYCKMGVACWYSHDGDENTPCHYGALCKAGHRHLVKTSFSAPVQRAIPRLPVKARPAIAPQPMARLEHSDVACAYCGGANCVKTQEFPFYDGNLRTVAFRAHCQSCLRTYSL